MNSQEKNLLDLEHSLYSTKASLFFSIGVGGALAILFGIKQLVEDALFPILIADIWFIVFVLISIIHFSRCEYIQREIRESLNKKKIHASK